MHVVNADKAPTPKRADPVWHTCQKHTVPMCMCCGISYHPRIHTFIFAHWWIAFNHTPRTKVFA